MTIKKQRKFIKPVEKRLPFVWPIGELIQGIANQAVMTLIVLTHKSATAIGRCRRCPTQRIELMITHNAASTARLHHIAHQVQRLADTRTTVNDIAQKQRLTVSVLPHTGFFSIAHLVQQPLDR